MCEQLLLTITQAASRLGVGRSKLYEIVRKGELASVRLGGARRIVAADLEDFVRALKERSRDEVAF